MMFLAGFVLGGMVGGCVAFVALMLARMASRSTRDEQCAQLERKLDEARERAAVCEQLLAQAEAREVEKGATLAGAYAAPRKERDDV